MNAPTATPKPNLGYKTGMSVRDAVNGGLQGSLLSGLTAPVGASASGGTAGQAAASMARSQGMNDAANMRHAIAGVNADQNMDQQAKRSDVSLSGLKQQQQQYQDVVERGMQEQNLTTDVYGQNLGYATGLATMQIRLMQKLQDQLRSNASSLFNAGEGQ